MKNIKKLISIVLCLGIMFAVTACGNQTDSQDNSEKEKKELTIAYQYGMAYAPLQVMMEQKLIEKHYDGDVKVNWQQLNSGSAINEGIAGGTIDIGGMGLGPFISGVANGIPYKMFSNLSGQSHGLMSNDPSIKSLKDVKDSDKIALVNIASFQHILLALASKKALGDAHALDGNIVAMAHPDGKTALENSSVNLHLTSAPYIYQERESGKYTELKEVNEAWPSGNSFIVGVASTKLYKEDKDLYNAVVAAMNDAIKYLNNNKEAAAKMLCENEGVDEATMLKYLKEKDCVYSAEAKGVLEMADFMAEEQFIDKDNKPSSLSDIAYDNVKGN